MNSNNQETEEAVKEKRGRLRKEKSKGETLFAFQAHVNKDPASYRGNGIFTKC